MRKLVLLHPLDGVQEFVEGMNCDGLVALDHGGYRIVRNKVETTIGPGRVDHFIHEPRPGLTPELPAEPPKGMKQWTDGLWHCNDCKYTSKTAHGVKTHRGMEHAG